MNKKELSSIDALCYLDDIAHGRKMHFDAHELKLIVEKDIKALEIIRKKKVDVYAIMIYSSWNLEDYNHVNFFKLTKKEYELLKEVFL